MNKKTIARLIKWISISLTPTLLFIVVLLVRKDYSYRGISDALFIPGSLMLFVFILKLMGDKGVYDNVVYGISQLFRRFKADYMENKVELYDYVEQKRLVRKSRDFYYVPYIVVSLVFILASVLFLILY